MVINNPFNFPFDLLLCHIQDIVIDQDDFIDLASFVNRLELVPEEKICLGYAAILKVQYNLNFTEELVAITIDHWNIHLAFTSLLCLLGIVIAQNKRTNYRIHIT